MNLCTSEPASCYVQSAFKNLRYHSFSHLQYQRIKARGELSTLGHTCSALTVKKIYNGVNSHTIYF